ncbi:MAG: YceI family protein [Ignavibacteria bacterium]
MRKIKLMVLTVLILSAVIITGCSKSSDDTKTNTDNRTNTTASNKGKKLNIVASESKLGWLGKKVTGQHNGTVDIKQGELFVENGKLTGGSFEFDFNTIKVLDIEDPETNAKLTGHLKSDVFFSATSHPIGKFVITSITPGSDGNYNIIGNLTIKSISKEVSFPAKVNINGDVVTSSADFNIDRTLWEIKYGSGKFFENLGDKLINDDFNIKFNITAK